MLSAAAATLACRSILSSILSFSPLPPPPHLPEMSGSKKAATAIRRSNNSNSNNSKSIAAGKIIAIILFSVLAIGVALHPADASSPSLNPINLKLAFPEDVSMPSSSHDIAANATTSTGMDSGYPAIDGNHVVFRVSESAQATDLNGDGDTSDDILHIYDIAANATTSTGLAAYDQVIDGNHVVFRVSESAQATDLNGDGDTSDFVLLIHDIAANATTSTGMAAYSNYHDYNNNRHNANPHYYNYGYHYHNHLKIDGNHVVFRVSESAQASTDLNGDGDTSDTVLLIHDIAANATTSTGMAAYPYLAVDGNHVIFRLNDIQQYHEDFLMQIPAYPYWYNYPYDIYDIAANATINGLYSPILPAIDGNYTAFLVSEFHDPDLNGDGDTSDFVLHIHDIAAGATTNTGLASYSPVIDGKHIAFTLHESGQASTDLNGDGDTSDTVLHIHDIAANATTNTGLATSRPAIDGNYAAFLVSESGQASTDLNGDGDTSDDVLHIYDLRGLASQSNQTAPNNNGTATYCGQPESYYNSTVRGTNSTEVLLGTAGNDLILGLGGNDFVYDLGGGNDCIYAGDGDDFVQAGTGDDVIYAGNGTDTVRAGGGADTVYAGDGDDFVQAGGGDDTVYAGSGTDAVWTGGGSDTVYGESGDDRLYANGGNNTIDGGAGNFDVCYKRDRPNIQVNATNCEITQ